MLGYSDENVCICGKSRFSTIFIYEKAPSSEVRFKSVNYKNYFRRVISCDFCGHYLSLHDYKDSDIYSNEYVDSNYENIKGIKKEFERIIALAPEHSDNTQRVKRILDFFQHYVQNDYQSLKLLDIGSGLGVFPYAMKHAGWCVTGLDPDWRSVKHMEKSLNIKCFCDDFMKIDRLEKYHLITFNKVLEHVADPIEMLRKSKNFLIPGGRIYIEVPDGEMAKEDGKEREEFAIDHRHIFSFTSLSILMDKSGYEAILIERVREPSSKFTLRAFCKSKENNN